MVTEQPEPDRARSCRNAIALAAVALDDIKLRPSPAPLDEPGQ